MKLPIKTTRLYGAYLRCDYCSRVVDAAALKSEDMKHPKLPNSKLQDYSQVVWKCPRCGCWSESE